MNPSDPQILLTPSEFRDRVMTAIALVPAPTPTRSFVASMRTRTLRDAVATLWVAWHLGTVRGWHVAPRVRARSFALVLAVASVLTTGSLAAAAAVHSVVPQRDDRNPVVAPSGSSVDAGPAGNGGVSTEPSPPSEEPTESEGSTPIVHRAITTEHASTATDAGHHPTTGRNTDAENAHHGSGDGNATDDKDSSDPSDGAHGGSGGGDQPAATDDHGGSGGPGATGEPDHHAATDGGSSGNGGGDAPDGSSGSNSGSDGSGG